MYRKKNGYFSTFNVFLVLSLFLKIQLMFLCVEVSTFLHACEGDAVTKLTNAKIPYFNAPIYLQNKTQIGKVDEIFGPINESVSSHLPAFSYI